MKNYIYSRCSTEEQDYDQQLRTVKLYLENQGITADAIFEEKEHGTVSAEERELKKVIDLCVPGDRIIVSEVSRVTRLGNDEGFSIIKKLEERDATIYCIRENLILGKIEKELNSSQAFAKDLTSFMFFGSAKMDRDLISSRTKSALDGKQDLIKKQGYFIAKKTGRRVERLGAPEISDETRMKGTMRSAQVRTAKAAANPTFIQAYKIATLLREKKQGNVTIAKELNDIGLRTPRGFLYIPASISQLIRKGNKLLESGG